MTAEKFLKSKGYISNNHKFDREINFLIEFAKIHVKAALKEANEKAKNCHIDELIDNEVLNAYSLENIK